MVKCFGFGYLEQAFSNENVENEHSKHQTQPVVNDKRENIDTEYGHMNALELFGGYEAIILRLEDLLRRKLRDIPVSDVEVLEQRLRLERDSLTNLRREWAVPLPQLSATVFEKLSCALSISIDGVLGNPEFKENEKAWREEFSRCAAMVAPIVLCRLPEQEAFEMFLDLRGVEELHRELDKDQHVAYPVAA